MRLDKYLQASRLIKRRTLANRLCDAGKVTVNGHRAKPAAAVEIGDLVGLELGPRRLTVRVVRLPEGRPSTEPAYEIVEDVRSPDRW
ncbi:MAG: RNA-binding S4 domain-containing protein [Armatimonadetes bacterium]|nr:RNA-binding S4 domain-containing protein [Armatimonadota bacterium]